MTSRRARSRRRWSLGAIATLVGLLVATLTPSVAHAAASGTISGTVTGNGAPLSHVSVTVWKYIDNAGEWDWYDDVSTGSTGDFSFDVGAGRYRIEADPRGGGWIREYFDDAPDLEQATDLVIDGNTATADLDLARTGGISGTVTLPAGEDRYRPVRVYDADGRLAGRTSRVDRDGTYSIWGLDSGTYRVAFNRVSGQAFAAAQFYDHKAEPVGLANADPITVTQGEVTEGVDAALVAGGQIAGTLVDNEGTPLPYCTIQAYTTDRSRVTRTAESNDDGTFSVTGLSNGSYLLRVLGYGDCDGGRQFYSAAPAGELSRNSDDATGIAVTLRNTTTLTPDLVYTRSGRISGHLTLPDGAGRHERHVVVRDADTGRVAGRAHASSSGDYTVRGLAGGTYRVTFDRVSGQAFAAAQFYDGKAENRGPGSADLVTVGFGERVTGVDATLHEGGHVTGKVVDRDHNPLPDCYVQAFTTDRSLITRTAWTREDGTFDIGGLSTGHYKLRVVGYEWSDCDGGVQFYDGNATLDTDDSAATDINVTLGGTASVGPLLYTHGARISGTVTLPDGATRKDGRLRVIDTATGRVAAQVRYLEDDGTFVVRGLTAGSYKVAFNRLSGMAFSAAQFYDGKSEDQGVDAADTIDVSLGETVDGVDAALVEGGHITGHLVDADGAPMQCYVQAFTADHSLVTRAAWSSGDDGSFDIGGLSDGDYLVRVVRRGDCYAGAQYLQDGTGTLAGSIADADPVTATLGGTVDLPDDLVYQAAAQINGTLALADGMSRSDFSIAVIDSLTGNEVGRYYDVYNKTHTYSIHGLAPGSYRVEFARDSGQQIAAAQFYDGVDEPDAASADLVVLDAGASADGIDATLKVGGRLEGTLVDTSGNPLSCSLQAFTTDGHLVTRSDRTDPDDGSFSISGLSTGDYLLTARGQQCGGTPRFAVGSGGNMTTDVTDAASVATVLGETVTLDSDLVFADPAVTNDAPPSISGTPVVGSTLTADPGTWSPSSSTFAYQWLAAGTAIDGATEATYEPVAADVGKTLKVRVTASRPGRTDGVATSAPTTVVVLPDIVNDTAPSISGSAVVGSTLTADPGEWTPSDATFAYQWLANGTPISGATSVSYVPVAGDVGKTLKVRVTASDAGHRDGVATSAPTTAVKLPTLVNSAPPSISGSAVVGQPLTADPGTWAPTGASFAYQWLADDAAISGATAATYTPAARDVGKTLTVRVTATKAGYTNGVATSDPTDAVAPEPVVNHARPTIAGTPKVGATLTAAPGTWTPSDVTFAYEWRVSGSSTVLGTEATFRVPAGAAGKTVTVSVEASSPGTPSVTATSDPTAKVALGKLTSVKKPTVTGKATVGTKLRAKPGVVSPAATEVTYKWLRNGKVIKRATKATYKLTAKDKGAKIAVRVTYSAPGYAPLSATSATTKRVKG